MKALILNGMLEHHEHVLQIQKILEEELTNIGWVFESVVLHKTAIGTCIGCFKCWDTTPGICFQDDQGGEVAKKAIKSDLLIFLTPITWGGYSSELKKAIERMLGLLHPSFIKIMGSCRHKKRYDTYPSVLGIAITAGEGDEEGEQIFESLIERHSMNWHTPKQRATVWVVNDDIDHNRKKITNILIQMEVQK